MDCNLLSEKHKAFDDSVKYRKVAASGKSGRVSYLRCFSEADIRLASASCNVDGFSRTFF